MSKLSSISKIKMMESVLPITGLKKILLIRQSVWEQLFDYQYGYVEYFNKLRIMSSFFWVFLFFFFSPRSPIFFCYIAGNCFPTVHSLIGHLEITWRLTIVKVLWIWMRACSCCLMLTRTSRGDAKETFLELINLKWLSIIYTEYDRWD